MRKRKPILIDPGGFLKIVGYQVRHATFRIHRDASGRQLASLQNGGERAWLDLTTFRGARFEVEIPPQYIHQILKDLDTGEPAPKRVRKPRKKKAPE